MAEPQDARDFRKEFEDASRATEKIRADRLPRVETDELEWCLVGGDTNARDQFERLAIAASDVLLGERGDGLTRWLDAIERTGLDEPDGDVLTRAGLVHGQAAEQRVVELSTIPDVFAASMRYCTFLATGFLPLGNPASRPAPTADAAAAQVRSHEASQIFERADDGWRVVYAGAEARLPKALGFEAIHQLLSRPGEHVSALALLGRVSGDPGRDLLDAAALRDYRNALQILKDRHREAVAGAHLSEAEELAEKMAFLSAQLKAARRPGGTKRLGDETDTARKAVSARIRRALDLLEHEHPALALHLRNSIQGGRTLVYSPTPPDVLWRT